MKQSKGIVIIIGVVAVAIIIGLVAIGGHGKKTATATTGPAASSSSATSQTDTSSAVATNAVDISNYMFSPMVVKVKVGDTVTWTNKDGVRHNVVADTASSDAPNGPLINQGETYAFKFTKAGTYTFHCMPHPYMKGTVVVTE